MKKFERTELIAKVENGKTNMYVGTEFDSDSNYLMFNLWEKGNKRRIYMNDYKKRSVGYIDLVNGNEVVTDYTYAEETAEWFLKNYEIA